MKLQVAAGEDAGEEWHCVQVSLCILPAARGSDATGFLFAVCTSERGFMLTHAPHTVRMLSSMPSLCPIWSQDAPINRLSDVLQVLHVHLMCLSYCYLCPSYLQGTLQWGCNTEASLSTISNTVAAASDLQVWHWLVTLVTATCQSCLQGMQSWQTLGNEGINRADGLCAVAHRGTCALLQEGACSACSFPGACGRHCRGMHTTVLPLECRGMPAPESYTQHVRIFCIAPQAIQRSYLQASTSIWQRLCAPLQHVQWICRTSSSIVTTAIPPAGIFSKAFGTFN